VGIVWSFPGFAHYYNWLFPAHRKVAKFCDGIKKLGDSTNGAIWKLFGLRWFLMMLTISFGQNSIGSCWSWGSYGKVGKVNALVAGLGWKTFLRWLANVLALTASLRAQPSVGFLKGITVSFGELRVGWALHSECFVLGVNNCSM